MKPDSKKQTSFSWDIGIENRNTLVLSIDFKEPSAISQMGVDRDKLRVYFAESDSLIACQLSSALRYLQGENFATPSNFVGSIELPPQEIAKEGTFLSNAQKSIDTRRTTDILMLCIAISTLLAIPSQVLYNGILVVQILSHIPLNNINLPGIFIGFMVYVNRVVGFKRSTLADNLTVGSLTPPLNANFYWMGYESMDFFENLGFVILLVGFILIRQVLGIFISIFAKIIPNLRCLRER